MLYLAELNRPIVGNPNLQLLAKMQQDSWQAVNEEPIPVDRGTAGNLRDGVLVLAEIGAGRKVSRVNEAARQLVTYLQNYSRLQDKSRSQEEEIETWKKSLTFQSQELNRREMELESQEEELQRLFEEYKRVEEDRKNLDIKQEEIATLEANLVEQQRAMGRQREEIQQQQESLQALLAESQRSRLSEAEAQQLQSLFEQLHQKVEQFSDPQARLQPLQDQISQQLQQLEAVEENLAQDRQRAQQAQEELDQAFAEWQQRRQNWLESLVALDQARAEVRAQETSLSLQQGQLDQILRQLQLQDQVNQMTHNLVGEYEFIVASGVDVKPQEPEMSLEELQAHVNTLRQKYEQRSGQVNQQLAELEQNRQSLKELQERLVTASLDERMDIEMDIDYAQSACQALEQTVLPQQENIQREYEELMREETRLARMVGEDSGDSTTLPTVDIGPIVAQLEEQWQRLNQEKQRLESEQKQLNDHLQAQQEALQRQAQESEQHWRQLLEEETSLKSRFQVAAESWGRIHQQQDQLQQAQAQWQQIHQQLDQATQELASLSEAVTSSRALLGELQAIVDRLNEPAHTDSTAAVMVSTESEEDRSEVGVEAV